MPVALCAIASVSSSEKDRVALLPIEPVCPNFILLYSPDVPVASKLILDVHGCMPFLDNAAVIVLLEMVANPSKTLGTKFFT